MVVPLSAKPDVIRYTLGECPDFGWVLVAATERGVCALAMSDSPDDLERWLESEHPHANRKQTDAELRGWLELVCEQLAGRSGSESVPIDAPGTAFQQKVWAALRRIPPGETRTYSEVAAAIGTPSGVRAVARACATNPVSVLTPCHRVIGTDGSLRGYRWGLARKQELLRRERMG